VIAFSGHGFLDMAAYDAFIGGNWKISNILIP